MSNIIAGIVVISLFFTILAVFVRLKYVALIYVIGNIIFIFSTGVLGGWYIILFLMPSFIPSLIGIFIGASIRQRISPTIANMLTKAIHNNLSKKLMKHDSSILNLDGTQNFSEDAPSVKEKSVTKKSKKN